MRTNCYFLIGMMLLTSLLARQTTNPSPPLLIETPASAPALTSATPAAPADTGSTNNPAPKKKSAAKKKSQKKSVARKKEAGAELKTVPLVAGPAVVEASHVNVRGQPKLNSEVVTR